MPPQEACDPASIELNASRAELAEERVAHEATKRNYESCVRWRKEFMAAYLKEKREFAAYLRETRGEGE